MVGTPVRRHSTGHRRTAAILALCAIRSISPLRRADRRAERRRLERDRRYRARLGILRDMQEFFELSHPQRPRRAVVPPWVDPNPIVVVSSDTSTEDLTLPDPEPQQQVIDLDSSLQSLPNIDPRPQFQLPLQQPAAIGVVRDQSLEDLGPLDITQEFPPPLQHQELREAYVLLSRLQRPPLRPLTPPPEPPLRPPTPPLEQAVDWLGLEAAVADFDALQYLVLPPPLVLQQPEVAPVPQFIPVHFAPPPPLLPVDWAMVAYALFTIAEREHERRLSNPNQN